MSALAATTATASAADVAARRAMTRATPPTPCYAVEGLPPKKGGAALYESLRTAVARGDATLVEALTIPPKDARSWRVPAGKSFVRRPSKHTRTHTRHAHIDSSLCSSRRS
jgi:hypothetical protein